MKSTGTLKKGEPSTGFRNESKARVGLSEGWDKVGVAKDSLLLEEREINFAETRRAM